MVHAFNAIDRNNVNVAVKLANIVSIMREQLLLLLSEFEFTSFSPGQFTSPLTSEVDTCPFETPDIHVFLCVCEPTFNILPLNPGC